MGLVKYEEVYKPQENITNFPVVHQTQVIAVPVTNPTSTPSNRFYLGSYNLLKASYVKAIVAEDNLSSGSKWVDGNRIIGLNFMQQMFITLIDYGNNVIVDHLPLAALAPVDTSDTTTGTRGAYFRTHLQFDPEASYVNWADNSRTFGGTRILLLTCYLQTIKK